MAKGVSWREITAEKRARDAARELMWKASELWQYPDAELAEHCIKLEELAEGVEAVAQRVNAGRQGLRGGLA